MSDVLTDCSKHYYMITHFLYTSFFISKDWILFCEIQLLMDSGYYIECVVHDKSFCDGFLEDRFCRLHSVIVCVVAVLWRFSSTSFIDKHAHAVKAINKISVIQYCIRACVL
jgi:hypothetical protein